MNYIEYRNVEALADHPLVTPEDRRYLRNIIKEFGWHHSLTDAVICEISHIRALACKAP